MPPLPGQMLPLEETLEGAAGGRGGYRPVHVLPRFLLVSPGAAAAAMEEEEAAEGSAAAAEEGAEEGAAAAATATELRPSVIERLLCSPPPSVLGWMVGTREDEAGVAAAQRTPPPPAAWPDGRGGGVRLQLSGLPAELDQGTLERAVRDSLVQHTGTTLRP